MQLIANTKAMITLHSIIMNHFIGEIHPLQTENLPLEARMLQLGRLENISAKPLKNIVSAPLLPIFPKTRAELFFNTTGNSIQLNWFRLQQLSRFDLHSRLSADLGFLVYTRNGLHLTRILPRILLNLQPHCDLEFTCGMDTMYAGVHKDIRGFQVGTYAGIVNNSWLFEFRVKKTMQNGIHTGLQVRPNGDLSVKVSKKTQNGKISVSCLNKHFYTLGCVNFTKEICDSTSILIGAEAKKKEEISLHKGIVGIKLSLSELTSIIYSFESFSTFSVLRVAIKRGGLHISLPLKVEKIPTLIGCVAVGYLALLTKRLYNYFVKPIRNNEELEKKQAVQDYILMITQRTQEMIQEETSKNGLVILKSYYGNRENIVKIVSDPLLEFADVIDTTIPLNFLVDRSCLKVPSGTKSSLQGFYKVSESPFLYIHYSLYQNEHSLFIKDTDSLLI